MATSRTHVKGTLSYVNFASTNYYFRLGISKNASSEEIRRAFRSLARIYHPDVADNKSYAEEIFKRLNEAYEVLSDFSKRRYYDQKLQNAGSVPAAVNPFASSRPQAPGPFGESGRSTSPPHFRPRPFTSAQGAFGQQSFGAGMPQPAHRPDLDIEAALEITLEDAVQGATYVVSIQRNDEGSRQHNLHTCRVQVPEGVHEGQRLRLRGLGYVDHPAFCVGDLYLTIRYAKHSRYRVSGPTLYTEIAVTPWEAALGARIRLPTLDGMADLHVPPGSQPGSYLRLSKQGLPQRDRTRGDMMVNLKLRVPNITSEKERELWRALAAQHGIRR